MSPVNTAYLSAGSSPTGFSEQSQIAGSRNSFVDVSVQLLELNSFTSTSATSATMVDRQLSVMSVSASSAILAYRSGNTVYQFTADAAVL